MGVLSDIARGPIKTGDTAPYWELHVGGLRYMSSNDPSIQHHRKAFTISGSYGLGGASEMAFTVRDNLEGYEDEEVRLFLGYGPPDSPEVREYFTGRLQDPKELHLGRATAYGPSKLMADQYIGEQIRYQGVVIEQFLRDMHNRAGKGMGQLEVKGGRSYVLEDEPFNEEISLLEATEGIIDAANFVFYDAPGYKRVAMPKPQPGQYGEADAVYTEDMYEVDALSLASRRTVQYSKVIVFRRADDGSYEVRAKADVPSRGGKKPLPGRIYYVTEFPGTQDDAQNEANRLALSLAAAGEFDFELADISINPELELFKNLEVHRTVRMFGEPYYEIYDAILEDTVSWDIDRDTFTMGVKGRAIRTLQEPLEMPGTPSVRTSGVVQPLQTATFSGIATTVENNGGRWGDAPDVGALYNVSTGVDWWAYVGHYDAGWIDQAHGGFDTSSVPDDVEIVEATLTVWIRSRGENQPLARSLVWHWHPWEPNKTAKERFLFNMGFPNAYLGVPVMSLPANGAYVFNLLNPNEFVNREGFTGLAGTINSQIQPPWQTESSVQLAGTAANGGVAPVLTLRYRGR